MAPQYRYRLAYFGYSVEFTYAGTIAEIRAEANRLTIEKYGAAPAMSYVEPGLPYPDYVPVLSYGPIYNGTPQQYGFA